VAGRLPGAPLVADPPEQAAEELGRDTAGKLQFDQHY